MTSDGAVRLQRGSRLWLDDEVHTVTGVTDDGVRLRSESGSWTVIGVGHLLADPTFRPYEGDANPAGEDAEHDASTTKLWLDAAALFDKLSDKQLGELQRAQEHLLEMTTGFRSGDPQDASPGEPRPEYAPDVSLAQRVQSKARELGYSEQQVWRRLRKWRDEGPWGLVDRRSHRPSDPLAGADPRLIDAIVTQYQVTEADDSTGSLNRLRRRVERRLVDAHGPGTVKMPVLKTFNRYVAALLPGRYTTGPATTRQSVANRPGGHYRPITAGRPGELVMIDTSWLDVRAYDPVEDVVFSVDLTIAIDVCTRSLLGWRLVPKGTKGVDAGLVIADAMMPEPMRPGWPECLRHRILRLPCEPLLAQDERFAAAAARPVVFPERIVIDHGKAFASQAVKNVCRRYGITIQDTRKYRPTDKPQVESAFKTIRSQFSEHIAGYKGNHVVHRGRDVDATARWTIEDLEEFFAEYVVAVYQRRRHTGLVLPGFPEISLSPNDAYRLAVHRCGFIAAPRDPNLFLELLPIHWCGIHDRRIQKDYLHYSAPITGTYNGSKSPYAHAGGAWPVRYDPRDMTQVYLHDPYTGDWHTLRWTHALTGLEPFTDITLRQVKQELRERGRDPQDQEAVLDALLDLQNRTDAAEASTARSRRARARDAERARAAARDKARTELVDSAADFPVKDSHLRAVPPLPADDEEEVTIDFDALPSYEVWGGRPEKDDAP
ncbi:transposase family protein [Streptomyces sp. RLB3-17]|uniref:DDE-type integrase/transposase/recombinase n=1 Tax=unclassified Streptomyces TaxID=2593676 RepID=UPI0011642827|nr:MULTISPECIES: DDE-type integrase/transposase/recombinase [unclassified Streptomyces]QDN61418.1 transposase family protein [Streptomyces sp. S1D4-20]QDN71471.1 transposase family protein [Streptomyces sp. S1D4-14]QDO44012.1 transposase family protein [Streptomyces sp. RLB3-17]QDO53927.1 transposase family protein [Streptomyces sp. RLB3-5]QDO64171.1 transposase family protein [Streptomyces sp. RLB1-8]